jgi:hypothetical protein
MFLGFLMFVANILTLKPAGACGVFPSGHPMTLLNLVLDAARSGAGRFTAALLIAEGVPVWASAVLTDAVKTPKSETKLSEKNSLFIARGLLVIVKQRFKTLVCKILYEESADIHKKAVSV